MTHFYEQEDLFRFNVRVSHVLHSLMLADDLVSNPKPTNPTSIESSHAGSDPTSPGDPLGPSGAWELELVTATPEELPKFRAECRKDVAESFLEALTILPNSDLMVQTIHDSFSHNPSMAALCTPSALQARFARVFRDQIKPLILRQTGEPPKPLAEEGVEKHRFRGFDAVECVAELVEDLGDKVDAVCTVWEILGREQMVEWRRLRWLPFKEWAATGYVVGLVVMDGWACFEGGRFEVILLVWALLMPLIWWLGK